MEGFSLGAILASIVASLIMMLFFGYIYRKKQSIKINKTVVAGDVTQKNENCDDNADIHQSLKLDNSEVGGSVSQENSDKKKL